MKPVPHLNRTHTHHSPVTNELVPKGEHPLLLTMIQWLVVLNRQGNFCWKMLEVTFTTTAEERHQYIKPQYGILLMGRQSITLLQGCFIHRGVRGRLRGLLQQALPPRRRLNGHHLVHFRWPAVLQLPTGVHRQLPFRRP